MLNSFRFYISWITSAVFMYAAFFVWHGLFLNDLNSISFSKALFLILAALVYLIISFVLYKTYESKLMLKLSYAPLLRGVISGFVIGFFLFAIAIVLGISFTKNINTTYIVADCLWQISEQILGGIVIGLGKIIILEPHSELSK